MRALKNLLKSFTTSNPEKEEIKSPAKIGICLSGGGALGYAHIGVLQALEDNGIFPQVISGSSMGGIVGTLYAAGITPAQMMEVIKNDKLYRITKLMSFNPKFWEKSALINNKTVQIVIKECIPNNSFETLTRKMYVCVANLSIGKWEIIHEGDNLDAWVAATCAIPGIYSAVKIENQIYVDGGLLNNMPAQPLKKDCDIIIGSDVLPYSVVLKDLKLKDTVAASARVAQSQNSEEGRSLCNFLIEPKAIEKYHEFNFEAYKEIYNYGYSAVDKFITENPEILEYRISE